MSSVIKNGLVIKQQNDYVILSDFIEFNIYTYQMEKEYKIPIYMKDQHGFNYALELSTTISNEALLFDITTKHETKTIFITGDVHFVKQSSSEAFKGPAGQNPKGYRRIARSSFKSYTGIAKNGIFFRFVLHIALHTHYVRISRFY